MGKTCIAAGCRNTQDDKALHFHSLPLKNDKLLKIWLSKLKLLNPPLHIGSRVCSAHFAPECYVRDLKHELLGMKKSGRLKEGAIPTIFDFGEYDFKSSDIPTTSKKSSYKQQKDAERIERLVQRNQKKDILQVRCFQPTDLKKCEMEIFH